MIFSYSCRVVAGAFVTLFAVAMFYNVKHQELYVEACNAAFKLEAARTSAKSNDGKQAQDDWQQELVALIEICTDSKKMRGSEH
ncbi:hypothetical protein [Denitrobaculum tricleocarpae]|uniref:Uncharacterized protein n=1 Tax=Denitrobaculum tricleocarpae TaxID=2591009 RepID=A0A545U279_9PROT|nr:hypothetical protein [Denitrobaculum tricleocarpae]TQV83585.1 hypothetical protein FKG95_03065 [Denitrobaculum tricleocarpae]